MLHQRTRDVYFNVVKYANRIVYPWYKIKYRKASLHSVPLHLGAGRFYLNGFINIDGNIFRKIDVWLDIRNRFPFNDSSVNSIYSCHIMEHFYPDELEKVLSECFRVLKPGGGMRIVVPDLRLCVEKYIAGEGSWFRNFPRAYRSMGGKLSNRLLCDGAHKIVFDFGHLCEVLENGGFVDVVHITPGCSSVFAHEIMDRVIKEQEKDIVDYSLYVDCFKPRSREGSDSPK